MKIKVLACNILWREISLLAAYCPNILDITYIRQEFHNMPNKLREILTQEIACIERNEDMHSGDTSQEDFDAVVLAYGLCGNGTAEILSEKYPIVVPRAHDCITLFLGSKERYGEYFKAHSGIYWYTSSYIESGHVPSAEYFEKKKKAYIEKYGEESAEMILEDELGYVAEYNRAAYVEYPGLENTGSEDFVKKCAGEFDWEFDKLRGDDTLLKDLLWGNWDNEKFITVPPGKKLVFSGDENIWKIVGD